jgi:hypothetical protein
MKVDFGELDVYPLVVYALIPLLACLYASPRLSPITNDQWFYSSQILSSRAIKVFLWLLYNALNGPISFGYMQVTTMLVNVIAIVWFVLPSKDNVDRNNN